MEDNQQNDTDFVDQHGEMILSLCWTGSGHQKVLGVAAFDSLRSAIFTDAIRANLEELESVLTSIKMVLKPTLLLLHPAILDDQALLEACIFDPTGGNVGNEVNPDQEFSKYRYQSLKSSCWRVESAKDCICSQLHIRSESGPQPQNIVHSNYSLLSSRIKLDIGQVCSSLGALLVQLQTTIFNLDSGKVTVSSIRQLPPIDFMKIDPNSFRALGIFATDFHPNVIKSKGREKEGFSLFSLLDRTKSKSGRRRLRDMMQLPFTVISKILHRQNGVSIAADSSQQEFVLQSQKLLRKWSDMTSILCRMRKAEATVADWVQIFQSIQNGLQLLAVVGDQASELLAQAQAQAQAQGQTPDVTDAAGQSFFLQSLLTPLEPVILQELLELLANALDVSSMRQSNTLTFRAGFDEELDGLRSIYNRLDEYLGRAARETLDLHPRLPTAAVEYVPQVGYLLSIAAEDAALLVPNRGLQSPGNEFPETDTRLNFVDSGKNFYKNNAVERLDNDIGDVRSNITDRQKKLLLVLDDAVIMAEPALVHLDESLSTLDAVLSMGIASKERSFVRPKISNERIIAIKAGRHPLQEIVVDSFIPNDIFLDPRRNVALITGPNCSGKSVYLKQTGIIVYMAMLGCYVPATMALVGVCDSIYTRISTIESQSTPQSSFAQDLSQMSRMLTNYSPRSLCIIDEFGKGTGPVDGIALLSATVRELAAITQGQGTESKPHCMIALHFTEIMHPRLMPPAVREACIPFQMTTITRREAAKVRSGSGTGRPIASLIGDSDDDIDNDESKDDEQTPLFRIRLGVAPDSQGIACALKAGVPASVVNRAKQIRGCIQTKVSIPVRPTDALGKRVGRQDRELLRMLLSRSPQEWSVAGPNLLAAMRDLSK